MNLSLSAPDELPALYRTILDLVVELERCDDSGAARRIRAEALAAYGGAWDDGQHRRLQQLEGRLLRRLARQRNRVHRWPHCR